MKSAARRTTPVVHGLLAAVILVMIALRFIHLEADFPAGLDWSTAAYTDEGHRVNAAAYHHLTGHWYVEGDYNPIVTMPVFQLAEAATFHVLGMSLFTARLTAVFFFIALLGLVFELVRRCEGITPALVSALLLSASFPAFLASRIALLDLPMTMWLVLSLLLAWTIPARRGVAGALLGALALSLGVLTKTLILFGVPVLAYAAWSRHGDRSERLRSSLAAIAGVAVIVGAYFLATQRAFPEDRRYFDQFTYSPRISVSPIAMLHRIPETLRSGRSLDPFLYPVVFPVAALAWAAVPRFRRRRLATAMLLWAVAFFVVMNGYSYHPPRYYMPLAVPLAVLASLLALEFQRFAGERRNLRLLAVLPWAGLAVVVCLHLGAIRRYLLHPEYSLRDMGRDVRERVRAEGGEHATIAGQFANTVGFVSGLRSMNDQIGTRELSWRLERYHPRYYVALVYDPRMIGLMERYGLVGDREPDREALLDPKVQQLFQPWGLSVSARRAPDGQIVINAGISGIRSRYERVLSQNAPFYHLSDHVPDDVWQTLEARYRLESIAAYNLYRNEFGHAVVLFRLVPLDSPAR